MFQENVKIHFSKYKLLFAKLTWNLVFILQLLSRLWSGSQVNSTKHTEQQLTDRLQQRFKEV